MTNRAAQLASVADQQVEQLLNLVSDQTPETLRQPCRGGRKLGDGSLGALISHTADNYQRIAEFAAGRGQQPSGHVPPRGAHKLPRFARALGHRRPDHGSEYSADNTGPEELAARLNIARASLTQIASLSEQQLDTIPPDGGFRFCDGKRNFEEVLRALFKHQARQLDSVRSTAL